MPKTAGRARKRTTRPAPGSARSAETSSETDALAALYAVVRAIPRGKVATYGQIAELAGIRFGHRIAARAMRGCPASLPWQRVLGKKDARRAQVNIADPEHASVQRKLLQKEGVVFDAQGFVPLRQFGWLPSER